MAILDIRQRAGYLFVAITLGHIVLISAQVRSNAGAPVLVTTTVGMFAEGQRTTSIVVDGLRRFWSGYVYRGDVSVENERLRRELAEAQLQLQQERAQADRSRGLERLLELRDRTPLQTVAAVIIAAGANPEFRTVTLGKGADDGIAKDMAVLAPTGVVGRVVLASPRASQVQLLIDRNAAAGALIERSRVQGVIVGRGDGMLRLDYMPELSDVQVGDGVVTSGIDGIFPKGFAIGQVVTIGRSSGGYREIVVQPSVDFGSLEEVLVVVSPAPAPQEDTTQ